jgi:hypothetical protein
MTLLSTSRPHVNITVDPGEVPLGDPTLLTHVTA